MSQDVVSRVTTTVAPGLGWPSTGADDVLGLGWPQVDERVGSAIGHTDPIPTTATQQVV